MPVFVSWVPGKAGKSSFWIMNSVLGSGCRIKLAENEVRTRLIKAALQKTIERIKKGNKVYKNLNWNYHIHLDYYRYRPPCRLRFSNRCQYRPPFEIRLIDCPLTTEIRYREMLKCLHVRTKMGKDPRILKGKRSSESVW